MQRYRGGRGLGGALGLVVYIVCILVAWVAVAILGVLVWSEIKALYEEDGRESPHTPLWGLWLLLPIVGNFVWFHPHAAGAQRLLAVERRRSALVGGARRGPQ